MSSLEKKGKITSFDELEKKIKCDFFAWELRIKGGAYYGFSGLSISDSVERMKKNTDILLFESGNNKFINVKNRFTNEMYQIPQNVICKQLRRMTGLDNIDFTNVNEFIFKKYSPEIEKILYSIYNSDDVALFKNRIKNDWENKVKDGLSNLIFARRIDLSASGTKLMAVYTDEPTFISANAWGVKRIDKTYAKILCLWMNSSFFLLDLLMKRAPTRGSWGQIDKRYLYQMSCIDLTKLTESDIKQIEKAFDVISKIKFPSLIEQLKNNFRGRIMIDNVFLKIFGMDEKIINKLYPMLWERINSMKETMKQD